METFGHLMFRGTVLDEQARMGSADTYARMAARPAPDALGPDEAAFIHARDSFYIATTSPEGWPYVQHRGGPPGFLRVTGPARIGFADYRGNRQYVTAGHLAAGSRVSLFLMDYARKARLKLLGLATVQDAADAPDLAARLATEGQGPVERLIQIDVAAFDWNCPKFITPRFTEAEIAQAIGPRIAAQEARIADLEARLAVQETPQ